MQGNLLAIPNNPLVWKIEFSPFSEGNTQVIHMVDILL